MVSLVVSVGAGCVRLQTPMVSPSAPDNNSSRRCLEIVDAFKTAHRRLAAMVEQGGCLKSFSYSRQDALNLPSTSLKQTASGLTKSRGCPAPGRDGSHQKARSPGGCFTPPPPFFPRWIPMSARSSSTRCSMRSASYALAPGLSLASSTRTRRDVRAGPLSTHAGRARLESPSRRSASYALATPLSLASSTKRASSCARWPALDVRNGLALLASFLRWST